MSDVRTIRANGLHEVLGADSDAVIIGHDWGAAAAYGATGSAPDRWRRAVTLSVPPINALLIEDFNRYAPEPSKRSSATPRR